VNDPRAEYARRLDHWNARIAALERAHLHVSNLRLAVAAAGAVVLWLVLGRSAVAGAWFLAPAALFGVLVVVHAIVLTRGERAGRAYRVYQRGIARLEGRWAGLGRDGVRFLDGHPFARDLDLFGRGSLFELLNTASTEAGEETLAGWLKSGADPDEVKGRQAAVHELRAMLDFREDLSVLAAEAHVSRTGRLATWAARPAAGLRATAAGVLGACGGASLLLTILAFADRIPTEALVGWLVIQSGIALVWRRRVLQTLGGIETPARDLALLTRLLERVERERFTAPRLTALQSSLTTGGLPPSRRIARLRTLVSWLDSTRNQLFGPVAAIVLLRSQLAVAIDRWHARWGPSVGEWLRIVGELEALSALGTYAYERPQDPFPAVGDGGPAFDARALGHPLLEDAVSVRNDVCLGGGGPQAIVVSGSNMSGKSTLLRSVGINVVLALAGAPVRAASVTLSTLTIGATLKVEDSLQAGHSRFYVEILRIRNIVDLARGHRPVLFLLDEILHGTNSHDRRIGAEAIVRALLRLGAIGLVTTHDLALTELATQLAPATVNMHFEDRLQDGKLVFDYRMRPGVVEHSNALALMRAIGLDV
jgi:hypothetical protein